MNLDENEFARMFEQSDLDDAPRPEHREQLRRQVLAAYDRARASSAPTVPFFRSFDDWRSMMSRPILRIAAAAALIAVVFFAGWLFLGGGTQVALAELIRPILEARSATFKITTHPEGQPAVTAEVMVLEPSRVRMEQSHGPVDMTTVMDFAKRKWLMLSPEQKLAIVYEMTNVPDAQKPVNYFDTLRAQLREAQEEPNVSREALGYQEVDGRRAIGYRITMPGQVMEIWGDPETRLPIRIELTMRMMPDAKTIWTDFEFNVELDESLFSVEVPAGYVVRSASMDYSPPKEEDFVEALRSYSKVADGAFPDELTGKMLEGLMTKEVIKHGMKQGEVPSEEAFQEVMRTSSAIGRGLGFVLSLAPQADAHYAGKGVKRDTPDRPVFWYRPEGKTTYRVLYADLSFREADAPPSVPDAQPMSLLPDEKA